MVWNAKNSSVPVDGSEMDYASFGSGRTPLVILPGLSDGLTTVKGKALMLAPPYRLFFEKYRVWMFSRRNKPPEGMTIRDMAEDQAQAMRRLGIEQACVMGVSQGGMIVQYLAIDHPALVKKLILAVTAPCVNDLTRSCVERWIALAEQGDHKALMIDTAERSYSEKKLRAYRRIYPLLGHVGKPVDYSRFLVNARAALRFDASAALGGIRCPTLILGGEEDRIVGAAASVALHEGIPGSELWLYPGLGHAVYEEAPDFNRRVFEFCEKE